MTDQQKRFADEYLIDMNATRAYKAAYPRVKKDSVAAAAAVRLLKNPKVAAYVEKKRKEREKRTEITQDRVLRELEAIGFANGSDFAKVVEKTLLDDDGNAVIDQTTGKPVRYRTVEPILTDDLPTEKKKAIAGIKQGKYGIEVASYDKMRALELIGKHLGMFQRADENEDALKKLDDILEGLQHEAHT